METGKTGSLIWTSGSFSVRVNWSETYDVSSNISNISISSIDIMSNSYYGYDYYPNGTVKINGTIVKTISSSIPTGYVYAAAKNTWYPIKSGTSSSASNISCNLSNISHNTDGSKSINIELSLSFYTASGGGGNGWSVSGAKSINLTTIPRASYISSVGNVTLGDACNVKWTPASSSFKYKLTFSLGSWSVTTGFISPNTTDTYTYTGYTIPNNSTLLGQIPNSATETMYVKIATYNSENAQIGSISEAKTFTVAVPSNIKPTIKCLASCEARTR